MEFLIRHGFLENKKFREYFDENNYKNLSFSDFRKVYESKNRIIKIAKKEELTREILGLEVLSKQNLSPKLIDDFIYNDFCVIIMEKVEGINLIDKKYLENPETFIKKYAKALKNLHYDVKLKGEDKIRVENMSFDFISEIENLYREDNIDTTMLEKIYNISVEEAIDYVKENYDKLEQTSLIHGDCCLPNIIFKDDEFSKFIDVDLFGMFDCHYDIFWAIWTLVFNLNTNKYTNDFRKYYGEELISDERLKLCGLISCLTGKKVMEKLK